MKAQNNTSSHFDISSFSLAALKDRIQDEQLDLFDAHCHLDFASNAEEVASVLLSSRIACFSNTVTPQDYTWSRDRLNLFPNVVVGLGLHPWWLLDGQCDERDICLFESLAENCAYIGEIGLDFGRKFKEATDERQEIMIRGFERAIASCMESAQSSRVISLHSVCAAGKVLDVLERWNCDQRHTCILHWFSGSSDELQRAIKMGCWFSVGPRMLTQKKGREYIKAIPAHRILLETDEPSNHVEQYDASVHRACLQGLLRDIMNQKSY